MKSALSSLLLSLSILISGAAYAESQIGEAESFQDVVTIVDRIDAPASTLLVMDDDDTLTMMSCPDQSDLDTCQYLGGPAWFDWQNDQLKEMAQPRVADDFDELLKVAGLLLAINYMPYTADDIPTVLGDLTDRGVRLLTETARGTDTVSATEGQFARLSTPVAEHPTLLALMNASSLEFAGETSKPSPFQPCPDNPVARLITYQQGVSYVSGQNKGVILSCLLDQYNAQDGAQPVRHVIFIDDTPKNVHEVAKAFADNDRYSVHALHYTALEEHKAALTRGDMAIHYQRRAAERWNAIRDVLRLNLQNPAMP